MQITCIFLTFSDNLYYFQTFIYFTFLNKTEMMSNISQEVACAYYFFYNFTEQLFTFDLYCTGRLS